MYLDALKMIFPTLKSHKTLSFWILMSILAMIGLDVAFSYWSNFFWSALQHYESHKIFGGLGLFALIAGVYILIYGFSSYGQRFLEFFIREDLYEKYSKTAMSSGATNIDQRLSEDPLILAQQSLSLMRALITSGVKVPVFTYILYSVSNFWTILLLVAFAALGTFLSKIIAKPLISLEFLQQNREGDFRRDLTYAVDNGGKLPDLEQIKINWSELAARNKHLAFFQSGFDQSGVLIPYLLFTPFFLAKAIDLGGLRQACNAVWELFGALSVLVSSRDIVVRLQMSIMRLQGLEK